MIAFLHKELRLSGLRPDSAPLTTKRNKMLTNAAMKPVFRASRLEELTTHLQELRSAIATDSATIELEQAVMEELESCDI